MAAGSGSRLGAGRPKAFVELAGQTLLARALGGALAARDVTEVVLVLPPTHLDACPDLVGDRPEASVRVVAGGGQRTDSVAAGLAALSPGIDRVLVHDAARCLTPTVVFERVLDALARGAKGAIPGLPVVDTIKVVDERGIIVDTPARTGLRAVQTPQGFDRAVLEAAYASGRHATDDAALVEDLGHDVLVVDGDALAMKITTVEDLTRAEQLVGRAAR